MDRHDWLVLFSHLGGFCAVLLIIGSLSGAVHARRGRGRFWAFLEMIRRYAADEEES